jgi:hypothetical protein
MHREDEGTALTEFVICLPVFIIIFIGISDLWKMQNAAVAVQIIATKNMWTAAIPVQQSMTASPMHMSAQSGGMTVVSTVNKRTQLSFVNKAIWTGKALGMGLGGHFGESYYMTLPIHSRFKNDLPDNKVAMVATDLLKGNKGKPVAELVNDSPMGGIAMLRPSIAAGIRYGMVGGEASQSLNTSIAGGASYTLSAGYDISVAPYPQGQNLLGRAATMLVVSQSLRSQNFYKTVYGIKWFGNPYRAN